MISADIHYKFYLLNYIIKKLVVRRWIPIASHGLRPPAIPMSGDKKLQYQLLTRRYHDTYVVGVYYWYKYKYIHICIYLCLYTYMYNYVYIYIYILYFCLSTCQLRTSFSCFFPPASCASKGPSHRLGTWGNQEMALVLCYAAMLDYQRLWLWWEFGEGNIHNIYIYIYAYISIYIYIYIWGFP